jgi:tetratricopeptide (TPR) repeat protein
MAAAVSVMRALVALGIVVAAAPAVAQSKKYPPVAPDKEIEDEKRSELWESTIAPDTRPYRELVRDAKRLVERKTADDTNAALDKLADAIKRLPNRPDAYLVRGRIYLAQQEWEKCADDLGRVEDYAKDDDLVARSQFRIELASCLARAGRLADAEATLMRAAASAPSSRAELLLRLGEVRVAMGKLDEAIDALTAAIDADKHNALARWLLVAAYDRARRPSDALEHASMARASDASRRYIEHPPLPLLGIAEADYLNGLAYRYAIPTPEYALLYFRRYVRLATDSPWKRRAQEHVRDLSAIKLPARETITTAGTSAVDIDAARTALERPVATMRACLAKLPASAFQISVTRVGARTPVTVRDRPIYRMPPAGAKVLGMLHIDGPPREEIDAATRCLQAQADKVKLPPPKERDTYYQLSFVVVSP